MRRIVGLLFIVCSLGLFMPSFQARSEGRVHAQTNSCHMVVEVFEVTPLRDKGDSLFGLRSGDMEFHMQVALTNGVQTWEDFYPAKEEWRKAKRNKMMKTAEFYLYVDMGNFTEDQLYLHFIALDFDPIEVYGYDLVPVLEKQGSSLLSAVIQTVGSTDMATIADALAKTGVEAILESVTQEDIIGEGGIFIDRENGWGTRVVQTYTTPDKGLKIQYQVYLTGESCINDKESV